jgi:hypothetical protein
MNMKATLWVSMFGTLLLASSSNADTPTSKTPPTATTTQPDKAQAKAVIVQYLKGQMLTTSPDGKTPYGPPIQVVAKRTIDSAAGTLIEDSWHGAEHHTSSFTLRAGTLIFDVSDKKKTFQGTMTFKTKNWLRGTVTYDIKMIKNPGTVTGTGSWMNDAYHTNKIFSDSAGTPRAKITEKLTVITRKVFYASRPK